MCLTINKIFKTKKQAKEYSSKPLIAKKDIIVYKVLRKNNTSRYKRFKFKKGYQYTNDKFGFSYYDYYKYYDSYKPIIKLWKLSIEEGLHSCIDKNSTNQHNHGDSKIIKMIIPKGSEYFLGKRGDIVSNKLIWY